MVSKKRQGDDPEAVAQAARKASGGLTQALGNTPGGSGGHTAEFIAGYRAHAMEMRETGLMSSNRLGMEILYLLPDDFLDMYQRLFHRALSGGDGASVMGGTKSGGLEKAAGATGMVTGSETKLQAQGSGKKYKNTPMFIAGDGTELRTKTAVDKELLALVGHVAGLERRRAEEARSGAPGPKGNLASLSRLCGGRAWNERVGEMQACTRFLSGAWKFCPTCGTRVDVGDVAGTRVDE